MKPLSKSIDSDFIHIVFKDTKQPDHELPDHLHDWHEIVYIYSGKGTFFIDQHFYDMSQGNIFVLPANTIHRAVPKSNEPVTSTALFFHPSTIVQSTFIKGNSIARIIEKSKQEQQYRYSIPEDRELKIESYFKEIQNENCSQHGDSWEVKLLLLHLLLIELNRHCLKKLENGVNHEREWLTESLIYIEKHLGGKLDLKTLAQEVSVSQAHFSRVFKDMIGLNLTDYIITKRIIWAKEKLLSTNDPVHLIANQCGFNSMPHFYRMFKRFTNKTPKEYRYENANR